MSEQVTLPGQLLTAAKVAWVLDVGHSTVEEWTRRRELESFLKGRVRRYEPAAVLAFIRRHTTIARGMRATPGLPLFGDGDWQRIERLIRTQIEAQAGAIFGSATTPARTPALPVPV